MINQQMSGRSYEAVALFYEPLAHAFSLGWIRAAKASQISELGPGSRVLYVGCGAGEDAVLAAKVGARVTCVDLSSSMLDRSRWRITQAGFEAEFMLCDVMDYRPTELYDAVAANFFLNIFPEPVMVHALAHLATLVKPGGKLLMADFAPFRGNAVQRMAEAVYYGIANVFFWILQLMPLHTVYDYSQYLPGLGFELSSAKDFGISSLGLYTYRSLVSLRVASD